MTIVCRSIPRTEIQTDRRRPAPALFQLLSDSALNRAALSACGFAIALLDAHRPGMPLTFANPALEQLCGTHADQLLGRQAGSALFAAGGTALLAELEGRVRAEHGPARARAPLHPAANGEPQVSREVDIALNAVRDVRGAISCWVLALHETRPAD